VEYTGRDCESVWCTSSFPALLAMDKARKPYVSSWSTIDTLGESTTCTFLYFVESSNFFALFCPYIYIYISSACPTLIFVFHTFRLMLVSFFIFLSFIFVLPKNSFYHTCVFDMFYASCLHQAALPVAYFRFDFWGWT